MTFSNNGSIGFSDEQAELLEVAQRFCREKSPVDKVRALIDDETGHDPAVWSELAELGWLAIAVPEEFGGVGLSLAEVVPVVEQMGRSLMGGPFLSTTIAAQGLLHGGTDAQKNALLPDLCAGTPAAVALVEGSGDWDLTKAACTAKRDGDDLVLSGTKVLAADAAAAAWLLVSVSLDSAPALVIVPRDALGADALTREVVIDETRRSYKVTLDGVRVSADQLLSGATAAQTLAHIDLVTSLLVAAEMCGGTASCIDYTVDYLKTRKQFGKLIGSYQALKHPAVDALIAYEQARSHVYAAAHSFSEQGEGEIATRMAKAQAATAMSFAADRAIQFHGGFGFTYDCDAQLYRRRAFWGDSQHGDAAYQRKKLADLMF
ncbi:Butyryl-CoA dehydrogenase [Candidatus Phaeomarinobacter ectocarpi]|uniref:Butyryl-CoA dehydrogenase n=1 Tax=Candidatus Phaeomarinibacter ectocarpi TaxID=1458461 RepID=X5MLE3_9HYPH|nr:acyl-CoA dehydrogenase family protein [Candidatus Phaeomarinobacter ectocarpi]CDO59415.1 Butyryl-CoA dehydrogenase [Candidatus Phaeomarinobacter ectocarpi]